MPPSNESTTHFELVDIDRVGLCSGAYGCTVVGVDAFEAFGLVRCVAALLLFRSDAFPTDIWWCSACAWEAGCACCCC